MVCRFQTAHLHLQPPGHDKNYITHNASHSYTAIGQTQPGQTCPPYRVMLASGIGVLHLVSVTACTGLTGVSISTERVRFSQIFCEGVVILRPARVPLRTPSLWHIGGGTLTSRDSSSSCARFARLCFLSFRESPEGALFWPAADHKQPKVSKHASPIPKPPPRWSGYLIGRWGRPSRCSGGGAATGQR